MANNENMSANMMLTLSASATVTATREEKRFLGSEHGGNWQTVFLPTVRFETQDGRTVETEIPPLWYWEAPGYRFRWWGGPDISSLIEVGDELTVVYDPQDPESAQIESAEHKRRETRETQRSCLLIMGISFAVMFFGMFAILVVIVTLAALFG